MKQVVIPEHKHGVIAPEQASPKKLYLCNAYSDWGIIQQSEYKDPTSHEFLVFNESFTHKNSWDWGINKTLNETLTKVIEKGWTVCEFDNMLELCKYFISQQEK